MQLQVHGSQASWQVICQLSSGMLMFRHIELRTATCRLQQSPCKQGSLEHIFMPSQGDKQLLAVNARLHSSPPR